MFSLQKVSLLLLPLLGMLLFTSCEPADRYGITGTWRITITPPNQEDPTTRIRAFRGDQVGGTVWTEAGEQIGTYQVTGTQIIFTQNWTEPVYQFPIRDLFTGVFVSPDQMSGTLEQSYLDRTFTATWTGTRL